MKPKFTELNKINDFDFPDVIFKTEKSNNILVH